MKYGGRRRGLVLLLGGVLVLGALAWWSPWLGLAHQWVRMWAGESRWSETAVWLPAYRVAIDARPIEGIAENASGLTFNPVSGTLFTVINKPPAVAEISRDGRLIRHIPVRGLDDPEGITHVRDDLFVLADERQQQLVLARIGTETRALDVQGAPRLGLKVDLSGNLGFEGVSWDHRRQRLLVAKEKSPLRIFEITGLPEALAGAGFNLQIQEWKETRSPGLFMRDLSSLTLHEPTGHMLLLSDESKVVVEYDAQGEPVSLMPLWGGWQGLKQSVPQAEGIAMDEAGAIYILSEPNLFLRYERTTPARWLSPRN
ncbi:MAG: SdiA-regulated domain-containing protein [Thiobacillaceae bacterium]|jgi:uncharacterized protein YjiK|nr:SdiA-regulated domain-containing protein [Thiobacillaceae bacterium]